jgi:Mg2+/Co2+ transporter CorB
VVVSIDPRRVYVNHPDDVPYKVIRVTNPGMLVFSPLLYLLSHLFKGKLCRLAIYHALNGLI